MKQSKNFFINLIKIAYLLTLLTSSNVIAEEVKDQASLLKALPTDIVVGDEKAPVTLIEYSSLSCPHCAHFHKEIFATLKTDYFDTRKVKYIHRDFPLDKVALKGAVLTHCAPADRYYVFLKVLFEKQESWAYSPKYMENLENIGKLGGISGEQFQNCLNNQSIETQILETRLMASNILQINATPTFYINGKKYEGSHNVKGFKEAFDAILEKK